jgi:hypothetical protein
MGLRRYAQVEIRRRISGWVVWDRCFTHKDEKCPQKILDNRGDSTNKAVISLIIGLLEDSKP